MYLVEHEKQNKIACQFHWDWTDLWKNESDQIETIKFRPNAQVDLKDDLENTQKRFQSFQESASTELVQKQGELERASHASEAIGLGEIVAGLEAGSVHCPLSAWPFF